MLYSVHFFIGQEFDQTLEKLGSKLCNDGGEVLKYCNIFRAMDAPEGKIAVSQLHVNKSEENDDKVSQSILIGWTELQTSAPEDWSEIYVKEIYNETLTADRANQLNLPVFFHFPLYKSSAVKVLDVIARIISEAERPSKVTFIGYGDDMVDVIEPGYKIVSPSFNQLAQFDALRTSANLNKELNRFIFIHNSTPNGISLGMKDSTAFVEMLGQLMVLMTAHMSEVFPMEALDVTALGFSSLNFNKYKFATYLLQKATLETIDMASVNNDCVDVNGIFAEVNRILYDKDKILSRFFESVGDCKDYKEQDRLRCEVEVIRNRVLELFETNKDITLKTAILAALFSKTEYELFSSSTYNLSNSCYLDLYNESVNYFINEDDAGFYCKDGEKAVNPIPQIKEINRVLMNAEEQIRTLEKRMREQEKNLEDSSKVRDCFIDDEFFHFDDKKFRLLPNVVEEPLKETYVPKPVTVSSADLRPYFRSVQNQGQQGSCLSFAITSIFEYMMKVNQSENCDLSEAFLYYNARNLDDVGDVSIHTDDGSRFKPAMDSLVEYGIALEMYCPYDEGVYDRKPSEAAYEDAKTRKLIKALNVDRNVAAIKSALAEGYPVAASFTLCKSFTPTGGYIPMPTDDEIAEALGNAADPDSETKHSRHAMAIVGFSDELQMFLVRNSWGQDWGDNGYCYIPYAYVADQRLFNFACIIAEVASLQQATPELKQIQSLKVDNTDVRVRYFITKAALEAERVIVEENQKMRTYWLEYFETIKTTFSNSNNRDAYVAANKTKLNEDLLALDNAIKEAEQQQDAAKEEFNSYNKKLTVITVVAAVVTCLLWLGVNWLSDKVFDASALKYIYLLPICGCYLLICFCMIMFKRRIWLERRDDLQNQIDRSVKNKGLIRRKLEHLDFKSYAAWMMMRSLEDVQNYFLDLYTKMISLINNLRAWYDEVKDLNSEMDIDSRFPNISLLDRTILDAYFDCHIRGSQVCDIDICDGLDQYEISADFLSKFKKNFTNKILMRLIKSLEDRGFNVSAHVADNSYSDLAKEITQDILESLNYQSNIFLHLKLHKRGDVPFTKKAFAPDLKNYETALRGKLQVQCGMPDYVLSDDNYRLMLASVVSLHYDECALLRHDEKKAAKSKN